MSAKIDESIQVYGAGVLLKHLDALREEMDGVRQGQDIECIHRMRVASRRLRNAFELFNACLPKKKLPEWQKQIRKVTHALGTARDTDVQIEEIQKVYESLTEEKYKAGLNRLQLRIGQKREQLQGKVLSALDDLIAGETLTEMEVRLRPLAELADQVYLFSPALYEHSFYETSTRLDAFLIYETYVDKPECITELHAMRISAKHLRYTLEAFEPLYGAEFKETIQAIRQIQDELGEVHDSDVWDEFLQAFVEKERRRTYKFYGNYRNMSSLIPGFDYFRHEQQEQRMRHYHDFYDLWQKLSAEQTWGKLREMIRLPFNLGQAREALSPAPPEG